MGNYFFTIIFYFIFTNIFAQQTDTLIIKTPNDKNYYMYTNDTLYHCIIDTCFKSNTNVFGGDFYTVKKGNVKLYYVKKGGFSTTDSIYVNGKANFYTDEKPLYDDIIADERGCYDSEHNDCTEENPRLRHGDDYLGPLIKGTILRGLREKKWTYSFYDLAPIDEHYTKGVRDKYRVYTEGKEDTTIYQTTFENGTGVEKMYRGNYGSERYTLYRITYFKNGEQDLSYPLEEFHPNGNLARLTDYQKGIITSYYSTGLLRSIRVVSFLDSLTNGKPTPVPKVASYFDRRGELISTYTFDKKGKVIDSRRYKIVKIGNRGVWYLERGNFRYYERGRKFYRVGEDGKEVEVEF